MTFEDLKTTLYRLEKIMYGHNYEVIYGMDIFDNCSTIDEFNRHLKTAYPNSKPENATLIPITVDDFWEEINFGLTYRGDNNAGLELNEKEQDKFDELQKKYKDFICKHIDDKSQFYSYPDETGIPGYPVFWDYRFAIQSSASKFLFIYASASD
jgi:hypothetical protein